MITRRLPLALLLTLAAAPALAQGGAGGAAGARTTLRIYAVGDINLGRGRALEQLLAGDTLYPFAALLDTLRAADILFGNFESPIAPVGHLRERTGNPTFTAPPIAADALALAGFDVVSTANNHAWDGGLTGVMETLRGLERVALPLAGTGRTAAAARRPVILERNGWRVAVFAVTRAYNPAPRAFYRHIGSRYIAYADTGFLFPAIRRIRQDGAADLVIVSIHAGEEYTPDPDPPLVTFSRGAVDAGADIILGHHPHVLRHVEWYRGSPIVYSMGNFVFEMRSPWTTLSAVFRFAIEPPDSSTPSRPRVAASIIPVRAGSQPRLIDGASRDSVLERVRLPATFTAPVTDGSGPR